MDLNTFIKTYTGKAINFDGILSDTGQCVALVAQYCQQVLKAPVLWAPYAVDWWTEYRGSVLQSHFDQIPVNKGAKVGDIAVFGASNLINSPIAGHMDIIIGGITKNGYTGFDSNWRSVKDYRGYPAAHDAQHTYTDVLGFLRLKPTAPPVVAPKYYNVVRGDTVTAICAKYKISLGTFAKLNPTIKNLDVIYIGQRVRVA